MFNLDKDKRPVPQVDDDMRMRQRALSTLDPSQLPKPTVRVSRLLPLIRAMQEEEGKRTEATVNAEASEQEVAEEEGEDIEAGSGCTRDTQDTSGETSTCTPDTSRPSTNWNSWVGDAWGDVDLSARIPNPSPVAVDSELSTATSPPNNYDSLPELEGDDDEGPKTEGLDDLLESIFKDMSRKEMKPEDYENLGQSIIKTISQKKPTAEEFERASPRLLTVVSQGLCSQFITRMEELNHTVSELEEKNAQRFLQIYTAQGPDTAELTGALSSAALDLSFEGQRVMLNLVWEIRDQQRRTMRSM